VSTIDDARSGFDQTFDYDVVDRLEAVTGFGAGTYTYDARGIRQHLSAVAAQIRVGTAMQRRIDVDGIEIVYGAHRISEGLINVGRITGGS